MRQRPGSPPPVGVSRVGTLSAGFQMGFMERVPGELRHPSKAWLVSDGLWLYPVSCLCSRPCLCDTRSSCSPSCPPVSPGWVGVGAGDLSLAACLPSETLGVGADTAVSYGPPTPMLLLCLGSGCGPPPPTWPSLGTPTPFPGPPICSGLKQASQTSRFLQAMEDSWRTPVLPGSPE